MAANTSDHFFLKRLGCRVAQLTSYRARICQFLLLALLTTGACQQKTSSSNAHPEHNNINQDPDGRCAIERAANESADCFAVRCAEDFVRRNGYTVDTASGPQRPDPLGLSVAARHATLNPFAIFHKRVASGHSVGFRYRDSSDNVGRAVTMSDSFLALTVDRVTFIAPPDSRLPLCAPPAAVH